MRLDFNVSLSFTRARDEQLAERETSADAMVERAEPQRIGFTADTGRLDEIPEGWS